MAEFMKKAILAFCSACILFCGCLFGEAPETILLPKLEHQPFVSFSPVKSGSHLLFNLLDLLVQRRSLWENHSHRLPPVSELIAYEHNNTRVISIVRDVRDQLVSAAKYWVQFDDVFPDHIMESLGIEIGRGNLTVQQVQGLIYYMISDEWLSFDNRMPKEIRNFHNGAAIYYTDLPCSLVIKYENLVGPQGGGDASLQEREIQRIGEHLGLDLTADEVYYVMNSIYGNSLTFRKGHVGAWKEFFDPPLCEAFKSKFGIDLILMKYETGLDWTNSLES